MTTFRQLLPILAQALCGLILSAPAIYAQQTTEILIRAAGQEGTELFNLVINNINVATFPASTTFNDYQYTAAGRITADDIRIEFINDLYDPALGIDANLIVDFIEIRDVRYETEDPSVFSTGTWTELDGVQPGFGLGEVLHTDGFFQYASTGSQVLIRALGSEGTEQFRLLLDGQPVATYLADVEFQEFMFDADEIVTPDQLQIEFLNDFYDPENGIDSNLTIDFLSIDGLVTETESPIVFSTGTWANGSVTPGFGRGDTLHSNGYFQYGISANESGVFQLEGSIYEISEAEPFAEVRILRQQGADTFATIDYQTFGVTAEDGTDFFGQVGTLPFEIGETVKSILIPIVDDALPESDEQLSLAIDSPAGAGLLVPRTATVTIADDDTFNPFPNFLDFSDVTSLALNGDASQSGDELHLTARSSAQLGSVFYRTPVTIGPSTSFQTQFRFALRGGTNRSEGIAFVIQSSSEGLAAIGEGAGGQGFEGIPESVAVRFDTRQGPGENSNNFIAVSTNGILNSTISENVPFDLNSGNPLYAFIEYNGQTDLLAVYLSETASRPLFPALVTPLVLDTLVSNQALVGFTGATGVNGNEQAILSWTYSDDTPPPPNDPPANLTVEVVTSGLTRPTAIDFSPDGQVLYIAEQRGKIHALLNGVDAGEVLDMSRIVNGTRDRGLLDIAIHPDLAEFPYLYTLFTYDPPQVFDNEDDNLAGPDRNGNRAARLYRWTLDAASNYTRVIPDSNVILLGSNSRWVHFNAFANSTFDFDEPPAGILPNGNSIRDFVASDSESHTIGSVEFAPDRALIVSVGDGTSYNRVDPRTTRVQDIDNLSGKILRINALDGAGLPDNPFYNGNADANRSKVYQLGVRNPFRISIDPVTSNIFIGDVGWTAWEEINHGPAGANFGWPYFEGGDNGNLPTNRYQDLPEAIAFYASETPVTPPVDALSHSRDGINAIVLGAVYRGNVYPREYQGDLFFNDLGQGIVRHADIDAQGRVLAFQTFATGAEVVVQIVQGPDGLLYFVDLDNGEIGRWIFE